MPKVTGLGHVGIHVTDLQRSREFYRDMVGLTITDEDLERGMVFMSARPEEEHHEFVLMRGREEGKIVQQISFRCASLADVKAYHRLFLERQVPIRSVVSHGNAISIYFADPDGNQVEVYYTNPAYLNWRQPFIMPVDLSQPDEAILNAHLAKKRPECSRRLTQISTDLEIERSLNGVDESEPVMNSSKQLASTLTDLDPN
ncbi:MAG: VOC family protein [Chloroflexota bacterium]